MANPKQLVQSFTEHYYTTFDNKRADLQALYRPHSMLSWEDQEFMGATAIIEKLESLPFSKVVHHITTRDVQPSGATADSLVVMVTGLLQVDDDTTHPLHFSQMFHLITEANPTGEKVYYVYNDMFRLNLGG